MGRWYLHGVLCLQRILHFFVTNDSSPIDFTTPSAISIDLYPLFSFFPCAYIHLTDGDELGQ